MPFEEVEVSQDVCKDPRGLGGGSVGVCAELAVAGVHPGAKSRTTGDCVGNSEHSDLQGEASPWLKTFPQFIIRVARLGPDAGHLGFPLHRF